MFFEFGAASMFEYLTCHAGFSNGSAYRLLDAARLQLQVPELAEKVELGLLNMSQVRMVQEASRELEKQMRKTAHANEPLPLFGEAPRLKDFRFETTNRSSEGDLSGRKMEVLLAIEGRTLAESEPIVAQTFDLSPKKTLKVRRQKDGSVLVELSFTAEQWAEIEKAKVSLSNTLPTGSTSDVFAYLAEKENRERAKLARPRPNTKTLTPAKKKTILQRDQCCQFKLNEDGDICGSKVQLQIDHIQPRWADGDDRAANLQVLCAAHNRWKYQLEAGIRRI
jgi:hypothetical protein